MNPSMMISPVQFAPEYIERLKNKRRHIELMCGAVGAMLRCFSDPLETVETFANNLQGFLTSDIDGVLELAAKQNQKPDPAVIIAQLDEARRKRDELKSLAEKFRRSMEETPSLEALGGIFEMLLATNLAPYENQIKYLESLVDAQSLPCCEKPKEPGPTVN